MERQTHVLMEYASVVLMTLVAFQEKLVSLAHVNAVLLQVVPGRHLDHFVTLQIIFVNVHQQ